MNRRRPSPALLCSLLCVPMLAVAQDHTDHHQHRPSTPPQAEDHSRHAHHRTDPSAPAGSDLPREPIPEITEADRAAAFPVLAHHMEHASELHWKVLFNRFEAYEGSHGSGQAWEGQAWIGSDTNRLWLRTEGERASGHTESANVELLYGRSISPWWDVVAGIRRDFLPGDGRSWGAIGVQGMAPYRFEVSATAYVAPSGRTAASFEAEYEVLLTNRLVLQPMVEASFHGKDDPARGIGSGLSTVETGLRLRYEITRRFAPYLGYTWSHAYGRTADYREAAGDPVSGNGWVAGIRFWF